MTKTFLLLCASVATLSLATGALGQSERTAPAAKEMAPPSGADMPGSRTEPGASGALDREAPPAARGDRLDRPEAQDRTNPSDKAGDTAKSEKADRDGSTGASDGTAGRDAADAKDKSDKRSKDAAESKSMTGDGASTGASEGTAGSDGKSSGSVTQLTGEKRTKAQSAFRSHRSQAVVKNIDIDINVGIAVPRSVSLYAVPEDVVIIVPEYRRYKYFIFGDKVVIVDPVTYEIVDVLILA
jgi:hypothetical protein